MRLEILDLAQGDFLSGFVFYERQEHGVGSYFFETLLSDIESLRLFGGIHRRVFDITGSFRRDFHLRFIMNSLEI